ncbi:MAG: pantoate--beta-alanine ligase [Lewinella sp.]
MQTFTTASALSEALAAVRRPGTTIGFVPTMGALHRGHAALIKACGRECAFTVASIFVNPTQFNEASDLDTYPRTPESDRLLLEDHGCDFLYLPDVADVYPDGPDTESLAMHLDYGTLTERLEGAHRPGHFAGVVQVVNRLLEIVDPDVLFLGQKDYQQVAVVRRMVSLLDLRVRLQIVSTVREQDGLALSSRNRRLSPDERLAAGKINQHLAAVAAGLRSGWPARELERLACEGMSALPYLQPEYVEVVDARTLLPYEDGQAVEELAVVAAVRVGEVRLIDNRIAYRANPS